MLSFESFTNTYIQQKNKLLFHDFILQCEITKYLMHNSYTEFAL